MLDSVEWFILVVVVMLKEETDETAPNNTEAAANRMFSVVRTAVTDFLG
jgi:hypothetical protein